MTSLPRALALSLGQLGDPAIFKVLGKTALISIVIFVAIAWGINALLPLILSRWIELGGDTYVVITILLTVLLAWVLFRIIALAVLQFFADDVVRAVERKHYGTAALVPELPLGLSLAYSVRATLRALGVNLIVAPIALVLLFTGVGAALVFWIANAVLLGRELQDMVWLRHKGDGDRIAPISAVTRFALGGIIAAMLAIPVLNFLAPIIGAASATHLVHRSRAAHA